MLNDIARLCWKIADNSGFHENRTFPEVAALIHSEVSEALEADRKGDPLVDYIDGKPKGVAAELIDVIIRCLDYLGDPELDVDIDNLLLDKIEYNSKRQYKHGKLY